MPSNRPTAAARDRQARTRGLEALVSARLSQLPSLTRNIAFPPSDPHQFLVKFLDQYIEDLPSFIDAMRNITKAADIFDFTKVFIDIAQDFHTKTIEQNTQCQPNAELQNVQYLVADAYLTHRLFEEVNDLIRINAGAPLIPMDLTPDNIIVHEILGEEFGNQLDFAVHYCIEALSNAKQLSLRSGLSAFVDRHLQDGWQYEINRWPCLAGDPSIKLAINLLAKKHLPPESAHR